MVQWMKHCLVAFLPIYFHDRLLLLCPAFAIKDIESRSRIILLKIVPQKIHEVHEETRRLLLALSVSIGTRCQDTMSGHGVLVNRDACLMTGGQLSPTLLLRQNVGKELPIYRRPITNEYCDPITDYCLLPTAYYFLRRLIMVKGSRMVYLTAVWLFLLGVIVQLFLAGMVVVARRMGWDNHIGLGHELSLPLLILLITAYQPPAIFYETPDVATFRGVRVTGGRDHFLADRCRWSPPCIPYWL